MKPESQLLTKIGFVIPLAVSILGLTRRSVGTSTKFEESMMKRTALAASFLTAVVVAASAFAQMGPGMGGMGPGGKGHFAWNKDYTPGWTLMTAQERTEWAIKMREVKTYDECKALQEEHHKTMEARAAEKGVKIMPPRMNGCDVMKARGLIR